MYPRRSFVLLHKESSVTLALIFSKMFRLQSSTILKLNFRKGNFMKGKQFHKTLTKATTIDYKSLILWRKAIYDGSLHTTRARTCHENNLTIFSRISKLLNKTLILKHHF